MTIKTLIRRLASSTIGSLIINLSIIYVVYMLCRIIFYFENYTLLHSSLADADSGKILNGSLLFDTSALCYVNSLYILLALLPVYAPKCRWWSMVVKLSYILPNAATVIATLVDSVFYPFNMRRITALTFAEFSGEDNIARVTGIEVVNHWYLVLAAAILIFGMWKLYRRGEPVLKGWKFYVSRVLCLALAALLVATGMRGGSFFKSTRPISINEAHRFVNRPAQTAIVMNTAFSIIRTLTQTPHYVPMYFTPEQLDEIYSPVHMPADSAEFREKNVVVLIVESFGAEFVGGMNRDLDNGTYRGYTPFTDSLLDVSMSFEQTFANGAFSIDAMPAVLASLPRMDHPFVLSPFAISKINSLASLLGAKGYTTAFFHGATNQSLGLNAFSHHAGYQKYFGLDEYVADKTTGGRADFDGTWGIWDEEFLQYFCRQIGELTQPFVATVFTLSSHHPFAVPKRYREKFPDEGKYPMHKCIRYTDYALRLFFESARKQPWYDNTIFVLTADHASLKITHDVYNTELGHFRIPILFFDPSGELPAGRRQGIAQQIDILPTLLDYLHYDEPYVAFGQSLLSTPPEKQWTLNWDNVLQFVSGDYVVQFTPEIEVTAVYNYRTDPLMRENLKGKLPVEGEIVDKARAIIQSYFTRANDDKLVITD